MKRIEIKMTLKKSTKGTHVYEEINADPTARSIPSVYIRRSAFDGTPPQTIVMTVSKPEEK